MRNMSRSAWLVFVLLFAGSLAINPAMTAQTAPEKTADKAPLPFGALKWRSLGPARGGRSIAAAGSAARPNEYYFGATGGGLWKTTNGGATWTPVTDGQLTSRRSAPSPSRRRIPTSCTSARARASCAATSRRATASTSRPTPARRGRTSVSSRRRRSRRSASIRRIPTSVYVAAFGHQAGPNPERGIFRSKDGGKTWEKVLYRDDKTGGIELNFDPKNPQVIYAALWEAFRVSNMMSSGGPGSGLFKSTDGGDHWTEISRAPGMPKGVARQDRRRRCRGADSNRVYAQIEAEDGGTFSSDDAGATWTKVSENRDVRQRAFYYTRVYADPKDKDTVYEPNVMFMKSTDGGKTWTMPMVAARRQPRHVDRPDEPEALHPRRTTAAPRSRSTAARRGRRRTMPTAQFYHVITTSDVPYHVCGAQQDNSTACVSSQAASGFGADRRRHRHGVLLGRRRRERLHRAAIRRTPTCSSPAATAATSRRFNRKTGQLRRVNPYPDNPMGYATKDITRALPVDVPDRLSRRPIRRRSTSARSTSGRRRNGGQTLDEDQPGPHAPRSGDDGRLGRADHARRNRRRNVRDDLLDRAVAEGRQSDLDRIGRRLRAGDARRRHDLEERHAEGPARLRAHQPGRSVAAPPGTAYVAANRYQHDDFAPYVYRTDDYGETWTKIVNGIAPRDFARAIREDTERAKAAVPRHRARHLRLVRRRREVAVAAAEPARHAGARHQGRRARSVIATHGRAFYVMDNISPLRQWGAADDRAAPVQAGRRAARSGSHARDRLHAEAAGGEDDGRDPRRAGQRDPHLHGHDGRLRTEAAGAADASRISSTRKIRSRRSPPACSASTGTCATTARPISRA